MSRFDLMQDFARRLRVDRHGLAMIEFAYALPLLLALGWSGLEVAHLTQTNLRISQIALTLADNASRVGASNPLAAQELREIDINDIFDGVRLQSDGLDLTKYGRITLSSLEQNANLDAAGNGGQWIHWQRCVGKKSGTGYDSSYGKQDDGKTGRAFPGMGEPPAAGQPNSRVQAPPLSAVMYVEINYDYQPLTPFTFLKAKRIQHTASFIVRDRRDLQTSNGGSGVFNPAPTATAMLCNQYTL